MKTSCCYWSEAECHKGSCEVAPSLMKYIKAKSNEGFQRFGLFCDRSGGQNSNCIIFVMLLYVLNHYEIDSITVISYVWSFSK